MALKDPTILAAFDPNAGVDQETQTVNPLMAGVPTVPRGMADVGAPFPSPKPDDDDNGDHSSPPIDRPSDSDSDSDGSSQAKSNPPLISPEELAAVRKKQNTLNAIGSIFDNLGNRQSFGNYFLRMLSPRNNSTSQLTDKLAQNAELPIQQKLLAQKQAMEMPALQTMQQQLDPNSPASKSQKDALSAGLSILGSFGQLPDDRVASMLKNVDNLNGYQAAESLKTIAPIVAAMKAKGQLDLAERNSDRADKRVGIQTDTQANNAAGIFDKDPLIQSNQRQLSQIGVDRHTLQTADVITPPMVHEISNGIASALNQGKAVGLGMADLQDMSTLQTKLAQMEGYLSNDPRNGASPEVRKQMLDTLDRLEDSYKKVQGARANQLKIGHGYQNNPAAQSALDQKAQSFQPAPKPSESPASDEDKQALDWAKQNPNDPRAMKILMTLHGKMNGGI